MVNKILTLIGILLLTASLFSGCGTSGEKEMGDKELARINGVTLSLEEFHQNTTAVMSDQDIRDISLLPESRTADFTQYPAHVTTPLSRMLALDCMNLLPEKYLMKADKATMANSIEERAPLLDREIIGFAFSIPDHLKIHKNVEKYVLRKAIQDLLPPRIINRPKVGFGTTIGHWMEQELNDIVHQKIGDGELIKRILKPEYRHYLTENLDREIVRNSSRIWTLFALQQWYDIYFTQETG